MHVRKKELPLNTAKPRVQAVTAADRAFFEALLSADEEALDSLLAPEFLIIDVSTAGVTRRPDFLSFVASAQVTFDVIETFPADSIVRELAGVVIVIGRTRMDFTMPDGTAVQAASRYTHIFTPTSNGEWQLASAQGTPIPNAPSPDPNRRPLVT